MLSTRKFKKFYTLKTNFNMESVLLTIKFAIEKQMISINIYLQHL